MSISLTAGPACRFNLLVAGEAGLGKTTFLKSILQKYQMKPNMMDPILCHGELQSFSDIQKVASFDSFTSIGSVNVHLFDCGEDFGNSLESIKYINALTSELGKRHSKWVNLDAQMMIEENRLQLDERIHCIVYFVSPNKFKAFDREFIVQVSHAIDFWIYSAM